jgi:thiol-disulfide isomerase/thioredoxin
MRNRSSARLFALLLALAVSASGSAARAQNLNGFQPIGEYQLKLDGKPVAGAQIFRNDTAPAYLIVTPALKQPVLLLPGSAMAVQAIDGKRVTRKPDGSVDVVAGAAMPQGKFQMQGQGVAFATQGRQARLDPNPPLLGNHVAPELKAHSPEYMATARAYKPNDKAIAALKKEARPVQVRVFFGSWCPHCKEHLPMLLRTQDEIQGSKIQFQYYGLPKGFSDEPEAKKWGIHGIPSAIVFVGGKEIGRIDGNDWDAPEAKLDALLHGGAARSR